MSTRTPARAYATVTGTDATFTGPDGHTEKIAATPGEDIRSTVVRLATTEAHREGTSLLLVTSGDRGEHRLLVHPDGQIATVPEPPTDGDETRLRRTPEPPVEAKSVDWDEEVVTASNPATAESPSPARTSFIAPSAQPGPVNVGVGWRGQLNRIGIPIPPSVAQLERADSIATVSRHWAGCRTISIANGKGGVGKTITTAMLASVLGRYGGGNVLAWDNNDTRGTLGWRTEQGLYDTTVRDLLPAAHNLLTPTAGVADITRFVHHQSADRYDVLRSNPELLATDQRIAEAEFDLLLQVAARFYRLVIFDSGNDESAQRWLRMVDSSHQLVIPTLVAPEPAESAALLLDALRRRDDQSRQLADHAVVIVTQTEPASRGDLARIVDGFADQVRHVAVIPYDPALKSGPLRFDSLRPRTRDAWTHAAAHTVEHL